MKKTIAIIITSLMLAGLVSGCFFGTGTGGASTKGDGNVTSEKITVEDFDSVTLAGTIDVNISFAESYDVSVTTDSNIQKFVKVTASDGVLNITEEKGSFSPTELTVNVTMPKIQTLESSGTGEVKLSNGSGEAINILYSGTGDISAEKYQVKNANVEIGGTGTVSVWATDFLSGKLSGTSDLLYKGTPKVDVKNDSTGEVRAISDEGNDD